MKIKSLIIAATLSLAAFTASATPQYTGNTFGSDLTQPHTGDSGYYLFNDMANPSNWSLRWTDTSRSGVNPTWFGSIVFETSNLGTATEYLFELGDDTLTTNYSSFLSDSFTWEAITNTTGGIDGMAVKAYLPTAKSNVSTTNTLSIA